MTGNLIKLVDLVKEELEKANTKHKPVFNSTHEYYAVLMEEIEEADTDFRAIGQLNIDLWNYIKHDTYGKIHEVNKEIAIKTANCIHELIQVIAMTEKFKQSFEPPEKVEIDKNY